MTKTFSHKNKKHISKIFYKYKKGTSLKNFGRCKRNFSQNKTFLKTNDEVLKGFFEKIKSNNLILSFEKIPAPKYISERKTNNKQIIDDKKIIYPQDDEEYIIYFEEKESYNSIKSKIELYTIPIYYSVDIMNSYNYELIQYINYILLGPKTFLKYKKAINSIGKILNDFDNKNEIDYYGSVRQGLATIFSDVDIVIKNTEIFKVKTYLEDIKTYIYNNKEYFNLFKEINIIYAKVPIINGIFLNSEIEFDISINTNGTEESDFIRSIIKKIPILRDVMIILKMILKSINYNKTYYGGISSYILFHMVYGFYLYNQDDIDKYFIYKYLKSGDNYFHQIIENNENDNILGFILRFLLFYSCHFKNKRKKIIIDKIGELLIKNRDDTGTHLLSIINMLDTNESSSSDIGKKCFSYHIIKNKFKKIYNTLKNYLLTKNKNSIINVLNLPLCK